MKQPWTETKEALFTTYQTDAHGLSGGEAQKRLAQYGENKLIEGKQKSVLRVFAEQFADLLVVILLIAAIISALTGGWEGTIVIITVLILNAILGTVQHFKAQKSLESLKAMSAPHARVLRDGEKLEISALSLVPGDILLLCSDGLTNAVPREQLEQLLRTGRFYDLPDLLIRTANENGGPDNITALLLCVEEVR